MQFTSFSRTAASAFTLTLACVLPAQAQSVSGQGTWETTLLGRDISRNAVAATDVSAVYLYDTTLNVTWLRNANVNGVMTWANATAWADSLSTGSGAAVIDNWRLPTMTDTGPLGCNFSYGGTDCGYNLDTSTSEMASLFYKTLGNKAFYNTSGETQDGYSLTNAGSFLNMQPRNYYWLGTEYAPDFSNAWFFDTNGGFQGNGVKGVRSFALAVRPGDVGAIVASVPEPETYAMMLAGLALIGSMARRRKHKVVTA